MENKNEKIGILEGIKIIMVCLVAVMIVCLPITLICKFALNMNVLIGVGVGILVTGLIIFVTGAWKPATSNDNNSEDDEEDDD